MIRFRLTGVAALDLTDASTSLLNQQSGKLSAVVLNEMGLADLQPLFPPLLAPDAQAGALCEEVAALTGLPAATPVAAGALDVCSAALGCGAVNDGDIYTILGTTCCTGIVCHGRQTVNEGTRYVTHTEAGSFINLFPMQAGTPNIDWLQQQISLIRIYSSWNSISPALNRAAAASSGSLISTANARRSSAPRRGQAISALASTLPAQSCSGRYLKVWLTLSSTRFRATRRAANCT